MTSQPGGKVFTFGFGRLIRSQWSIIIYSTSKNPHLRGNWVEEEHAEDIVCEP